MSIVRVGLAETRNFAEGYDAIFGAKAGPKKKTGKPAKVSPKGKKEKPAKPKPKAKKKK